MASPFENLLQASQFAIQTRMNYDQMIERKNENVSGLMQRRAEQQQQNQQFISEMNQKDKESIVRQRQFDAQIELAKETAENQNNFAMLGYNLQKGAQDYRQNFEFPAEQKAREETARFNAGMLNISINRDRREQQKSDRDLEAERRVIAAREAGPITIDIDPATDFGAGYSRVPGRINQIGVATGIGFLTGGVAGVPGGTMRGIQEAFTTPSRGKIRGLASTLVSEDVVKLSKDVDEKISESIRTGRPLDPNSLYQAYIIMKNGFDTAKRSMSKEDIARADYALKRTESYIPIEILERLKTQK